MGRKVLQYMFYPLLLIISGVGCFICTNKIPQHYFILIPSIVLMATLPLMVAGEFFMTYRQSWVRGKGDFRSDLFSSMVVLPSAGKLAEMLIPILFYFPVIWLINSGWISMQQYEFHFVTELFVALLLAEFFYYWTHRFFHKIPVLWRFHAIHHGAERVYWMNAGRFHVVEAFVSCSAYFLPLVLLGVSEEVLIVVVTLSGVTGFAEHINVDFRAGILNYVFNTAEHHRWHHSENMEESNKNYGKVLIIWDIVFGTFFLPKTKQVKEVGIGHKVPNDVFRQFVYPFSRVKDGE